MFVSILDTSTAYDDSICLHCASHCRAV